MAQQKKSSLLGMPKDEFIKQVKRQWVLIVWSLFFFAYGILSVMHLW